MTVMGDRADNQVILLVEDDPDHEALTLRALRRSNVRNDVVVTHDGAEALDYLFGQGMFAERDLRVLPRFIVLDLKLPKIDGLEVLQRLRADERTKLVPVVVLTSSDEERDMVACYSGGANSYVRKPVDFNQFTEAARQLGIYWLQVNEFTPRVSGIA